MRRSCFPPVIAFSSLLPSPSARTTSRLSRRSFPLHQQTPLAARPLAGAPCRVHHQKPRTAGAAAARLLSANVASTVAVGSSSSTTSPSDRGMEEMRPAARARAPPPPRLKPLTPLQRRPPRRIHPRPSSARRTGAISSCVRERTSGSWDAGEVSGELHLPLYFGRVGVIFGDHQLMRMGKGSYWSQLFQLTLPIWLLDWGNGSCWRCS
jgi:hypothetical protein